MEWNETYQILNNRKCNVNVFPRLLQFVCSGKKRIVSNLSLFSDSISHTWRGDARQMKHKKRTEINLNLFDGVGNFSPAKKTHESEVEKKNKRNFWDFLAYLNKLEAAAGKSESSSSFGALRWIPATVVWNCVIAAWNQNIPWAPRLQARERKKQKV